ncbi:HlyD family type I secretion periplasmic adaptor subunit [Pseudovibrio sp. Tun.PSC04-5.I4]|uniref:HlyD family type I secretion periplasmic adaptor subunit n=1 Tax=Pseudovibrio sp. Tun.PSC04-5.I4 TaxID=1798213 RepID=UPI0008903E83|nr:HlyD family type I secretion periplasmic adaptor subunit [Pseudovibrio sp. Tun.PSC04-5.I4]SDQ13594.1 HlyD family secretion protein [Pseudovibrio sp. Tun.PSC04-5.I4]SDR40213.1 HlyD family secretion protein [Pseudovibrio sp. Tun.PSC04-5.I4]
MSEQTTLSSIQKSRRKHMGWGLALVGILVIGLGGWASVAQINSAIITSGSIVVEGQAKKVQHQEGGIIGEILVKDGDRVKAGDVLFRLDETVVKANLSITRKRLYQMQAQEARLSAEWRSKLKVTFPNKLTILAKTDAITSATLEGEQALFAARQQGIKGRKMQLGEQISQLEQQIVGLTVQRDAKAESIDLVTQQLSDFSTLLEKRLINASQVTAIKRERAELVGQRGGLISQVAQTKEAISEKRIQVLQLDEEFLEKVLSDLQEIRAQIAELEEQEITAEDRLKRIDIRSPQSGYVHQLNVHTVGGVIAPGDILMLVVPEDGKLIVETRVVPTDVDQLLPGQSAYVRLAAFDQRTTPELGAIVLNVAPDLTRDQVTGEQFYLARLKILESELPKLGGQTLVPGMPVEGFIQTGERTVLSYFIKPLRDQIAHALKEK